jgi:hypothetical protein
MNEADAAARLRYVSEVRQRTRRAATVIPSWVLPSLGALLVARGLLMRYEPGLRLPSTGVFVGLLVARTVLWRYLSHRRQRRGGVVQATRYQQAPMIGAIVVGLLAPIDAGLLALAAALALSAWITGQIQIAAATVGLGIATSALILQGTSAWSALVMFGAGLMALGVARALTRGEDR